ncbi:hypothetical protein BpHYR1_053795 [Brachionus plicatilis]|uniref:Secreted protein n=1 Tax=Brachionus plicatilis TaxID=10195 RepID=A0A3M7TAW2_BRAPC|nr:hypothetical protein BpHYR1_053795 [Brachionus plicatilis]
MFVSVTLLVKGSLVVFQTCGLEADSHSINLKRCSGFRILQYFTYALIKKRSIYIEITYASSTNEFLIKKFLCLKFPSTIVLNK